MFQVIYSFLADMFSSIFSAVWAFVRERWHIVVLPLVRSHGLQALGYFLHIMGFEPIALAVETGTF